MLDQRKFRLSLFERLGVLWCHAMHNSPMWPIRGEYRCRKCGRGFQIAWAGERAVERVPISIESARRVIQRAA